MRRQECRLQGRDRIPQRPQRRAVGHRLAPHIVPDQQRRDRVGPLAQDRPVHLGQHPRGAVAHGRRIAFGQPARMLSIGEQHVVDPRQPAADVLDAVIEVEILRI